MARNEEIVGCYAWDQRIFSADDPEQRCVIGELRDGSVVKGHALPGDLETGLTYRFLGHFVETRYGKQFHFSSFALAKPSGEQATVLYLAKGPNIGRATAQRVWNTYGEQSLEVVRKHPERIATEIPGLTPERAAAAAEYFRRFERLEKVTIEVNDLLAGKGFPRTTPDKVIRTWGEESPRIIREQTWPLMRFRGVGFMKCDALYLELGRDAAAIERQALCLWHSMASNSDGHTWFPVEHCRRALKKSIARAAVDLEAAIAEGIAEDSIAERLDYRGGRWLAEAKKATAEQRLAEYVRRAEIEATYENEGLSRCSRKVDAADEAKGRPDDQRQRDPGRNGTLEGPADAVVQEAGDVGNGGRGGVAECKPAVHRDAVAAFGLTRWPAADMLVGASESQAEEYTRATTGMLGILAGSPGTGKSWLTAAVVHTIRATEGAARIGICAPTGKAAVRCTENLSKQGVAIVATTIHRLLGVQQVDAVDGWAFVHGETLPLDLDFLFVDEFSMCDATLAAALLAARPNGCHVLLVGDPDQLSPVGHGAPLRDLIAAGLPCGHLREIRRNAGRIVRSCAEIRDRQRITFSPKLDLAAEIPENLLLLDRSKPDDQIAELEQFLSRIAGGKKYDPVWDCQVVVPVNEKSPLARKTLNKSLQQLLNPDGEQLGGCPFRVGDKVVCLKNGSLPLIEGDANGSPTKGEAYVANGEQARVVAIAENCLTLRLELPGRLVRVPRGKKQEAEDGEEKEGNTKAGCNFDLAYAISVHKSQGSEWPIVIVMLDGYGGAMRLCDRHWLLTAVSRAKVLCVCIGAKQVALSAVKKSHMWDRKTFLRERIEELRVNDVQQEWRHMLFDVEEEALHASVD